MRLILFMALRQLWSRKLLNGIAVGGVAMGVMVLIAVHGVMQGFQMKFKGEILKVSPHISIYDRELGRPQTTLGLYAGGPLIEHVFHAHPGARVTRIKRPRDLVRSLQGLPAVQAACMGLIGQAILSLDSSDLGVDLRGVLPLEQERCTPISTYVTQGSWRDLSTTQNGAALGSGVASRLAANLGDQLRVVAPGGSPQTLKVVAIFDSGVMPVDDTRVYTNLTTVQTVLQRPEAIGLIELRLHDPFQSREVAERLERLTGYDAESWQEANANFLALFDTQNTIIGLVIGAILAVGGFGILAIQIMIVLQKTRDIAILRSVGLRRADIMSLFFIQGVLVSLLGAIIGDLVGWRLLALMATLRVPTEALVKSATMLVYEDPIYYVHGLVFALLTGVSASLLPAWRGSQVSPVDVLRGQI